MKSEMDVMSMDERQRLSWLKANRGALLTLGVVWLGMIVWELAHNRTPTFLIVMIPIIAFIRFLFYRYYISRH
jgi:hypothetical protein